MDTILNADDSTPEKPNGDRGAPDREDEGVGVDDGDAALVVVSTAAGCGGKPAFCLRHGFVTLVSFYSSNQYL